MAGLPEMVGGRLAGFTTMPKAGSDALAEPSLTLMTMLRYGPIALAAGVPASRPVLVLKVAHAGRLAMLNVSALPSGSDAAGWNK